LAGNFLITSLTAAASAAVSVVLVAIKMPRISVGALKVSGYIKLLVNATAKSDQLAQ